MGVSYQSRGGGLDNGWSNCPDLAELIRSESLYRSILQTAGGAIVLLSPEILILEFNGGAERIYGCKGSDVIGKNYLETFIPREEQKIQGEIIQRILDGESLREFENEIRRIDGERRTILWNATRLVDEKGDLIGALGIGNDITERKQFLETMKISELKLRYLSNRVLQAQEQERKRIALELHDDFGNCLTGIKLEMRIIEQESRPHTKGLEQSWSLVMKSLDQAIKKVRQLSHGLSPVILEDLGLTGTLKHLLEYYGRHQKIRYTLKLPKCNIDKLLSLETQVAVYRVFQEALTNVVKHSGATHLRVEIKKKSAQLSFAIEDNGVGFRAGTAFWKCCPNKGFGLTTMEQRITMQGGSFSINSDKGLGTRLFFEFSIEEQ